MNVPPFSPFPQMRTDEGYTSDSDAKAPLLSNSWSREATKRSHKLKRNTPPMEESFKLTEMTSFSNKDWTPVHRSAITTSVLLSDINSIDSCVQKIVDAYVLFCEEDKNLANLPQAVNALSEMERLHRVLEQENSADAERMQYKIAEARRCVGIMNAESSQLTQYDLANISTFFAKPCNNYYFDPETGKKYIQPDHSQLMVIGGQMCAEGKYGGTGLKRQRKVGGIVCDILYLNKRKDQIEAETGGRSFFSFFFNSMTKEMEQRIDNQIQLGRKLYDTITDRISNWNYSGFLFCTKKEILELFENQEFATKSHAILFYYKKADSEKTI